MIHVILYEPEIPPNTGNIIRLCANTNTKLHLIKPLGFNLDSKNLQRAGLDYHELTHVMLYENYLDFQKRAGIKRVLACSTKGSYYYHRMAYQDGDGLLFGPESRGLPVDILIQFPLANIIRIPMQTNSRSLNLSNATAIILYEALRQNKFKNLI